MLPKSRGGTILTVAGGVLAVVVVLFVVLAAAASYKTMTVERRWEAGLGGWEEILERHPPADADGAARELERLSAALGIDTATRGHEDRIRPIQEKNAEFKAIYREMGQWRQDVLRRDVRGVPAPPVAIQAFFDSHEDELAAIRAHLGRGVAPRWEMHLERAERAPIPNLSGHMDLQKLLIADALAKTAAGDRARALQDLEASWTLMLSIADAPILISQMIAVSDAELIAGALRHFEDPSPRWRERLAAHDFRGPLTDGLRYEGLYWTKIGGASGLADDVQGLARRLVAKVGEPYLRYCLADVSDRYRERLENLSEVGALCDYDLSARDADLDDIAVPRWNVIGRLVVPNLNDAVNRLARLELDVELTRALLELDEARRANGGAWPDALPGDGRSSACPKDGWIYEVTPEGAMTLAFDRDIDWGGLKGLRLPTRFTIR